MNKKIELRKVRDFGEVINDTFVFIAQNWKQLLKAYAVICGFFVIASLAVSVLNQLKAADYLNSINIADQPFSTRYSKFGYYGWTTVIAAIFAIIAYTAIPVTTLAYIAVYREKGDQPAEVEEVWSYFKFYFVRTTLSWLLLGIGLVIGFVMCIIPGVYLWPAFSLVVPIMVFENTTLGYAFSRSFELIKGNYWPTLGVVVIAAIIVYVAMLVFVLPLSILNVSTVLVGGHKFNTTYLILTSVMQHICQAFYMMPTIAIAICYFSLTEQKDNTGLLDRINSLGSNDELDQPNDQQLPEEY